MAKNYAPSKPVAGASRADAPSEVTRWGDYADTIADVGSRLTAAENATSRVWSSAGGWNNVFGVPADSWVGQNTRPMPAKLLDAATTESVVGSFVIPDNWVTFDLDLWWANPAATGGDVVWEFGMATHVAGDLANEAENAGSGASTLTAGSQLILTATTIYTAVTNTAGAVHRIEVIRTGASAGDTLASDIAVCGVMARKVS